MAGITIIIFILITGFSCATGIYVIKNSIERKNAMLRQNPVRFKVYIPKRKVCSRSISNASYHQNIAVYSHLHNESFLDQVHLMHLISGRNSAYR